MSEQAPKSDLQKEYEAKKAAGTFPSLDKVETKRSYGDPNRPVRQKGEKNNKSNDEIIAQVARIATDIADKVDQTPSSKGSRKTTSTGWDQHSFQRVIRLRRDDEKLHVGVSRDHRERPDLVNVSSSSGSMHKAGEYTLITMTPSYSNMRRDGESMIKLSGGGSLLRQQLSIDSKGEDDGSQAVKEKAIKKSAKILGKMRSNVQRKS